MYGIKTQGARFAMSVRKKENLLIFLCWFAYTASYLGRYSYNANINLILSDFGVTHGGAGLVTTMFFFAYGIGQIVNGILCRFYPKRQVITGALAVSAGINLAVFAGAPFGAIKFLWLANGAALSVLWSSLVLTLSEHIGKDNLGRAIVVMNTTVAVGNFSAYGLAGIFSSAGNYKLSFLTAAGIMAVAGMLWFFVYPTVSDGISFVPEAKEKSSGTGRKADAWLLTVVILLAVFAVADNLIKDGLHTWIPSVLSETFAFEDSNSIFLTMALNLFAVLGTFVVTLIHKKIENFVVLSTLLYAVVAVFLAVIVLTLQSSFLAVFGSFAIVIVSTHAINAVITSMAPMYLREKCNPGLLSGILNGCCYVGSTISSYGLGTIADGSGWSRVFVLLWTVSAVITAIGIAYSVARKLRNRRKRLSESR